MSKHQILVVTISALLVVGFAVTSLSTFVVSRNSIRSEIQMNTLPLISDNIY